MAATKSSTSFTWSTGSSTTSGTTVSISTSTHYADTVYGSLVTSGSAPTVAATVQVQESPDGSTWYSNPTKLFTAGLGATTTYTFEIALDPTTEAVQLVYVQQTTGTGTLTAQLGSVTGI